jgi:hypothetical protein
MSEQSVQIFFRLSDAESGTEVEREEILEFQDSLSDTLAATQTGELDGDERGDGYCRMFLYGSDADAIVSSIVRVLQKHVPLEGSYLLKRHGPPGTREDRVDIGSVEAIRRLHTGN